MWKTIEEFPDYEVSTKGEVRRKKSKRLLSPASCNGYMRIGLRKNKITYTRYIHRLVAEAFIEKPTDEKVEVNHKDGNRANNTVENLEWLSHKQNVIHSFEELGREANSIGVRVEFFSG